MVDVPSSRWRFIRRSLLPLTVLAMLGLQVLGNPALAAGQRRIALVIGNGGYTDISKLPNAVSDATLMAKTLESLGFQTTLLTDADQTKMKQAIATLGRTLRAAPPDAVGLFYYAGHGVQNSGSANYLVPTDAQVEDEVDLDVWAVPANWVLSQMNSAHNATNILILDACRNNPFGTGMRSAARGLAAIDAPTGSFIAYSTAPGAVAADGNGENSPFTITLAEAMLKPGIPIEQMFKGVRVEVRQKTNDTQTPFDSSSLVQDFYFNPAPVSAEVPAETELWNSVRQSGDAKLVALFLQTFPNGLHAQDAKSLLASIDPSGTALSRAQGQGIALAPEPQMAEANNAVDPTPKLSAPAQSAGGGTGPEVGSSQASSSVVLPGATASAAVSTPDLAAIAAAAPFPAVPVPGGTNMPAVASGTVSAPATQASGAGAPTAVATTPPSAPTQAPAAQPAAPAQTAAIDPGQAGQSRTIAGAWETPFKSGSRVMIGKSISELVKSFPLFTPMEGLDRSYWENQHCDGCHQWTQETLCTQAKVISGRDPATYEHRPHPLGPEFKLALAQWAKGGCQ